MSEFEDPLRVGVGDDEEDEEQVASDNTHGVSEDKEDQDDGVLKVEEDTREEMIQSKSGETLKDKEVGTSEGKINDVTRVTVTDPVKQVSDHSFLPGVTTSHVEYLVISEFVSQGKRVEVRRRFNDFVVRNEFIYICACMHVQVYVCVCMCVQVYVCVCLHV